jgi:hypothetical protein
MNGQSVIKSIGVRSVSKNPSESAATDTLSPAPAVNSSIQITASMHLDLHWYSGGKAFISYITFLGKLCGALSLIAWSAYHIWLNSPTLIWLWFRIWK